MKSLRTKLCAVLAVAGLAVTAVTFIAPSSANAASTSVTVCGHKAVATSVAWRIKVLQRANNFCNAQYQLDGEDFTDPEHTDCSGLVMATYRSAGIKISLPHRADKEIRLTKSISRTSAQPGDVVAMSKDGGNFYHHIAIYLGNGYIVSMYNTKYDMRVEHMYSGNTKLRYNGETIRWGTFSSHM
jgi:cell wall-associated NlpC family hydrolase